jgi:hypothetical protein
VGLLGIPLLNWYDGPVSWELMINDERSFKIALQKVFIIDLKEY